MKLTGMPVQFSQKWDTDLRKLRSFLLAVLKFEGVHSTRHDEVAKVRSEHQTVCEKQAHASGFKTKQP